MKKIIRRSSLDKLGTNGFSFRTWSWIIVFAVAAVFFGAQGCRKVPDSEKEPTLDLPPKSAPKEEKKNQPEETFKREPVPEFFLISKPLGPSTLKNPDGREVSLETLIKGKTTLLAFWYPDKENSAKTLDQVYKKTRAYFGSRINLVAVAASSGSDTSDKVRNISKANRWSFPVLIDDNDKLRTDMNIGDRTAFVAINSSGIQVTRPVENPEAVTASGLNLNDMLKLTLEGRHIPGAAWTDIQKASCMMAGKAAPGFVLPNSYGRQYELGDYKGRPVILAFFAVTCSHCRVELPILDDYYRARKESKGFEVLAVAQATSAEAKDALGRFASDFGFAFPVLADLTGNTLNAYSIQSVPTVLGVDKNGFVRFCSVGGKKDLTGLLDIFFAEMNQPAEGAKK